jgi:glycosyltransferase involved in cell wall biosynthesis
MNEQKVATGNSQATDTEIPSNNRWPDIKIALITPCHNEEAAIGKVVEDFKNFLPEADIYVYNNNSTDDTVGVATSAGAIVREELFPGKGNVVRRMFSDVEADIYVLVDGDDTYHAESSPMLINHLLENNLDMVNGARQSEIEEAYRFGHRFGNWMLTSLVSSIFGNQFKDMLSGYRIFSRRFVKSFPALSSGFEIETELTIHALELKMPVDEITTPYKERPEGSESKLRTIHDGIRILKTIALLVKEERPFHFFSLLALILAITSIIIGWPVITEYLNTGLVPRFPTAILASAIMILSFLSFTCGLILDTVTLGRREIKRMNYLRIPTINQP